MSLKTKILQGVESTITKNLNKEEWKVIKYVENKIESYIDNDKDKDITLPISIREKYSLDNFETRESIKKITANLFSYFKLVEGLYISIFFENDNIVLVVGVHGIDFEKNIFLNNKNKNI